MNIAYYAQFTLEFPQGVHFGSGGEFNSLTVERDGNGKPVLRGSSLAGWLRSVWRRHLCSQVSRANKREIDARVEALFGRANDERNRVDETKSRSCSNDSAVRVTDVVLATGLQGTNHRTHHTRDRHRGIVLDAGLFTVEACPPGTTAKIGFWVNLSGSHSESDVNEFLGVIANQLNAGAAMGGASNRGFGSVRLANDSQLIYRFSLGNLDEHAEYLGAHRQWRSTGEIQLSASAHSRHHQVIEGNVPSTDNSLRLKVAFSIPRGQDLLVADGQAVEVGTEPQWVRDAQGIAHWRIPGASLRGAMRSYMNRLAKLDPSDPTNIPITADSADDYEQRIQAGEYTGENLGRCFVPRGQTAPKATQDHWPIAYLFGNTHQPGRIKISDGLAACSASDVPTASAECQHRVHVAVDRITGGAAPGLLFDNRVLVGSESANTNSTEFEFTISVASPHDYEVRWLAKFLVAIHLGVIRIGSSKSAGRLQIARPVEANGLLATEFQKNLDTSTSQTVPETSTWQQLSAMPAESSSMTLVVTGKLVKPGKTILFLPNDENGNPKLNKIGELQRDQIPRDADISINLKQFNDGQLKQGIDVIAERDPETKTIRKIYIPGEMPTSKTAKASTIHSAIGEPFHNPYTFLRFKDQSVASRTAPTLRSAEELHSDTSSRFTGIIRLKVTTKSPLKSCHPDPIEPAENGHQTLAALTIGKDVIVPATGIRGSLRTLMTILTNGTLGYVDASAFLVQARDTNLGPPNSHNPNTPSQLFPAEVIRPGNASHFGTVRLGAWKLVSTIELSITAAMREFDAAPIWMSDDLKMKSGSYSTATPWRLRLSGPPVGEGIKEKQELLFKPSRLPNDDIELPASLWSDFAGRNATSDLIKDLKKGHIVWLQATDAFLRSGRTDISAKDVNSIQWARLCRLGTRLSERIPREFHPDSWNGDRSGKVDEVTNLFGQVAEDDSSAIPFAGRIRPSNLVFPNAKTQCSHVTLPPLLLPHPGCVAFYRDETNPDRVGTGNQLRGYKVYRTSNKTGADAPWLYETQPVFQQLQKKAPNQPTIKTVELLPAEQTGDLELAVHGLTKRELALVIQTCLVPWRLGGGKPLGLGLCKVEISSVVSETGCPVNVDELLEKDWQCRDKKLMTRVAQWIASQKPVDQLRYPRAELNRARGGHAWFGIHAKPKLGDRVGLTPIHVCDPLASDVSERGHRLRPNDPVIPGQCLPFFDPNDLDGDALFGYDTRPKFSNGTKVVSRFEPLDLEA